MKKTGIFMIISAMMIMFSLSVQAADIYVSIDRIKSGNNEYGVVRAYENGAFIWEFTTPTGLRTELEGISEVYQNNGISYIAANNILYALDSNTGNVKWQVADVGASNAFTFDSFGNIYISGYYGPNIMVIDSNGNVLYRDESIDYYWVYDLKINGNKLNIYYDSDINGVKTLDISQFANISVLLNGNKLLFDQPPTMINDRVMVPIRVIFEAMGYSVNWNQSMQTATATQGNNEIIVQLNNNIINYSVNEISGKYTCDVPPQIISDRILVPVRAISESAGCNVAWNSDNKTVVITK